MWTREELIQIGEICLRHNVTVVSDEIHCELTYPGHAYTPFASLPETFTGHAVTCISPSKAFNIAGLQIANIVAPDEDMHRRIDKAININEGVRRKSFRSNRHHRRIPQGEDWLDQLLAYLQGNYRYMKEFCTEHLPDFPICKLEELIWYGWTAAHWPHLLPNWNTA